MEISTLHKIIEFDPSNKAALCTQIGWKGSVPRKDYPMMMVDLKGKIIGTVGGGALEHSVIEESKKVIKSGKPMIKYFDLTNQDISQDGSVCGGKTTVVLEPYTDKIRKILKSIINYNESKDNILITVVKTSNDVRIEREISSQKSDLELPEEVKNILNLVAKNRIPQSIKINNNYYLIQYIGIKPTLHIFGAGHVGQAVAEMAHFVDLDTKIYDERIDLATNERFPYVKGIVNIDFNEIVNKVIIHPNDYVLVATRGHKHDFKIMNWLLSKDVEYISLVSSDKKWQLISDALKEAGYTDGTLNKVHSPVGLDIGSETVPEIAISIIAEIINHYRKGEKSSISLSKNNE